MGGFYNILPPIHSVPYARIYRPLTKKRLYRGLIVSGTQPLVVVSGVRVIIALIKLFTGFKKKHFNAPLLITLMLFISSRQRLCYDSSKTAKGNLHSKYGSFR